MKSITSYLMTGLITLSSITHAQINTPGSIYAGAGVGVFLGGGNFKEKVYSSTENNGAIGAGFNLNLRGQYAFARKFSAGIYFKTAATGFASVEEDKDWNTLGSRQLMFGLEAKYYFLNKKRILLSVGPQIGVVRSKDKIELDYGYNGYTNTYDGTSSGLLYGVNFGFNLFWSQHVGMFVDVGLSGSSLQGDTDDFPSFDYHVSSFGVAAAIGIITRFGGTPTPPAAVAE